MDYYDYRDWIEWSPKDITDYASEIASKHRLSEWQTKYLKEQMLHRAGYWFFPTRKDIPGPEKMPNDVESAFRSLGNGHVEVFEQNRRINRPYITRPIEGTEVQWRPVGSGLTKRYIRHTVGNDPFWRLEERRQRRRIAKRPFATLWPSIRSIGDDAFWASNCYPVDSGTWLNLWDDGKPYESPLWYAHQLERMYENAKKQASTGNVEGAMWHAFRAGELQAELNLTLAHGRKFEKYDAVNRAQRDAAKARKSVPDETRRDVYWKYRKAGHKKIEAGRQAAKELGLSEPSIRNAFPGARYPAE